MSVRHVGVTALRWLAFPCALAIVGLAWLALRGGWLDASLVQMTAFALALALVLLAERLVPFRRDWQPTPGAERRIDLRSAAMVMFVVDPLLKFGLWPALLAAVIDATGSPRALGLFPTTWPVPAQLALAVVVAELGGYWLHRWAHGVSWLWGVHRFHHDTPRIYWLNGLRVNPLNIAWFQFSGAFVLMALGTPAELLMTVTALTTVVTLLQHANADLRYDGWNLVFATADLHRWHHDIEAGDRGANFGSVTVLWDHVFGTWRSGHAGPAVVGVDARPAPEMGYWRSLWGNFNRRSTPAGTTLAR